MSGRLEHLHGLETTRCSYKYHKDVPAMAWEGCREQEPGQSKGARSLNPHGQIADRSIADGADRDEDESGYEEADRDTRRLSHRIELSASCAKTQAPEALGR